MTLFRIVPSESFRNPAATIVTIAVFAARFKQMWQLFGISLGAASIY